MNDRSGTADFEQVVAGCDRARIVRSHGAERNRSVLEPAVPQLSRSQDWLLNECCRALLVLVVDTEKNETDRPYIAFRNHPIITHSLHSIVCLASCIAKALNLLLCECE